jgi:hypothetical protein
MREVVELPEAQLAALDAWRATRGMSRAEAIQQAVNVLIEQSTPHDQLPAELLAGRAAVEAAFGLWNGRPLDGLAEQERLRAEWDDR